MVTPASHKFKKYTSDMTRNNLIDMHGKSALALRSQSYALVEFNQVQVDREPVYNGATLDVTPRFKTMYIECVRSVGRNTYDTGHRGTFPRPRWRYLINPDWTKTLTATHSDDPLERQRIRRTAGGFTAGYEANSRSPSFGYIDRTGAMIDRTELSVKDTSRANHQSAMTMVGCDLTFLNKGSTLRTILDSRGQVIRDQLDWPIKGAAYSRSDNTMEILMDNRKRFQ